MYGHTVVHTYASSTMSRHFGAETKTVSGVDNHNYSLFGRPVVSQGLQKSSL